MRRCLLLLLLSSCADPAPDKVQCTLQVDCGRGEVCVAGSCIAAPFDAGTPDSGAMDATMDAGVEDIGVPDTGPPCPAPIEVVGRGEHCDLQEAIDAALPGDVVRLPNGSVSGEAQVSTALTIEGRGSAATTLRGQGGVVLSLRAANITVRKLRIEPTGGTGVEVIQQAALEDVHVINATGHGVRVEGTGIATLTRVVINGVAEMPGFGVLVESGGVATLDASVIENAASDGIRVSGGSLTTRSTDVRNSGGVGIEIGDGSTARLEAQTRVSGNGLGGIVVLGADFEMRAGESSRNGPADGSIEDGLWLLSPTRSVIEGSTFSDNRGYGIFCSAGVLPDVCTGNVLFGNQAGETNCMGCN